MKELREPNRRVSRPAEEKAALLKEWAKSGLSAQAFERKHGLSRSSLWRFRSALEGCETRLKSPELSPLSFAAVRVKDATEGAPISERACAEIRVGEEVRIRLFEGFDVSLVTKLVHTLLGSASC
jgi:hypothetical protein